MPDASNCLPTPWFAGMQVILHYDNDPLFMEDYVEYPKDRFIEYGPEDDWWLIKYGYAKRKKRSKKIFMQVFGVLHMHVDLWNEIKRRGIDRGVEHPGFVRRRT